MQPTSLFIGLEASVVQHVLAQLAVCLCSVPIQAINFTEIKKNSVSFPNFSCIYCVNTAGRSSVCGLIVIWTGTYGGEVLGADLLFRRFKLLLCVFSGKISDLLAV